MQKKVSPVWGGVLWILICVGLFFLIRSFPFFQHEIPLGYDPGLYRSMFLAYQQLGAFWQFDLLPARIQSMYEPLLGMWGSLWSMVVGGGRSDGVLTRGRVVISFLPLLGIRLLGNTFSRRVGYIALLLGVFSFTQWSIFWRAYRKQAIGMFLVCVVLRGRSKNKRRSMIPVLVASCLVTRSAALFLMVMGVFYAGYLLFRTPKAAGALIASGLVAIGVGLVPLLPLWNELIAPLLAPLFSSLQLPTTIDGFQSGGTFLTIYEYFLVGWVTVVTSIGGRLIASKQKESHLLVAVGYVVLIVRVFFHLFFFQRIIGYLDMLVIVYAAVAMDWGLRSGGWKKRGVVLLIAGYISIGGYRMYRTYRPLIEPQEFAFLSQISTSLEDNAIIIVPGINYSPRVQGWTQRDILAPGLFDLNRRGGLDQQRDHSRYAASGQQKCTALVRDYPQIRDRPVYLWIGSKQASTSLEGSCFHLLETGQGRSWRSVRF